jgi:hypothetical protein
MVDNTFGMEATGFEEVTGRVKMSREVHKIRNRKDSLDDHSSDSDDMPVKGKRVKKASEEELQKAREEAMHAAEAAREREEAAAQADKARQAAIASAERQVAAKKQQQK